MEIERTKVDIESAKVDIGNQLKWSVEKEMLT